MRGHLRSAAASARIPLGPCAGCKGCPPAGGSGPLRPYSCAQSPPRSGPCTPGTCGIAFCPIRARRHQKAQKHQRAAGRHERPRASERAHGAGGSVLVAAAPSACCDPSPFIPYAHLLVTGRPLPVPGTGHARKSGVGGAGRPGLLPRDAPGAPEASPALRRPSSIMQPAARCWLARMCCATPAPHPLPPPLSRLAQVGVAAS